MNKRNKTEVCIIGTIHQEEKRYKKSDLMKALQSVKPDVILFEFESHGFTEDHKFSKDLLERDGFYDFMEGFVVNEYAEQENIPIRPYEIEGRDEYYRSINCAENESKMFDDIETLFNNNELNEQSHKNFIIVEQIMELTDSLVSENMYLVNSEFADSLFKTKHNIFNICFPQIIKSIPKLNKYRDFYKSNFIDYWKIRNDAMTDNIIQYTREYQEKKIVVIVGFEHRPYLLENLKKHQKENSFVIKNFWDYETNGSEN